MSGVETAFAEVFGYSPEGVWAAPGRINLIGEHTDYNDGFALPFALDRVLSVAAARRTDGTLRLRSRQEPHGAEIPVTDLEPGALSGWAAYPAGSAWALQWAGHHISGMDLLVDSTVPTGAGLSSSAAMTCASTLAMVHLHGIGTGRSDIARTAQRAESEFVGMPCGMLDQTAAMLATGGHALFMDTRSARTEHVPFDPPAHGLALLAIDTRAPHRLVDGEYAQRRRCCEQAARELGVSALRDVDPHAAEISDKLPDERTRRRVRHVVTENERVLETMRLLNAGQPHEVGPLLTASHASLRDDYEVSAPEVDTAVDAALESGALGARITGAGFGGCAIALVEAHRAQSCTAAVRDAFHSAGFAPPVAFDAVPSAGARWVSTVS